MYVCNKCKKEKSSEFFYFKKTGYRIKICKACSNEARRGSKSYDIGYTMLYNAGRRAKKKGLEFSIAIDDIRKLNEVQGGRCALTGWELDWTPSYDGRRVCPPKRVSLDRIDSGKGYTLDNIQLVCDAVNRMKNNYPEEIFFAMCAAVTEMHPSS